MTISQLDDEKQNMMMRNKINFSNIHFKIVNKTFCIMSRQSLSAGVSSYAYSTQHNKINPVCFFL